MEFVLLFAVTILVAALALHHLMQLHCYGCGWKLRTFTSVLLLT